MADEAETTNSKLFFRRAQPGKTGDKTFLRRCPDDPNTCLILESISDGVFTVDKEWYITSFNRAAEEITGTSR